MPARGFRQCQRTLYMMMVEEGTHQGSSPKHGRPSVHLHYKDMCFPPNVDVGDEVGRCDQEHVAQCHITHHNERITFVRVGGCWQPFKRILAAIPVIKDTRQRASPVLVL